MKTTERPAPTIEERFGLTTPLIPEEMAIGEYHRASTVQDLLQRTQRPSDALSPLGNFDTGTIPSPDVVYWVTTGQIADASRCMRHGIEAMLGGEDADPRLSPTITSHLVAVQAEPVTHSSTRWTHATRDGQQRLFLDAGIAPQRRKVTAHANNDVPIIIDPLSYQVLGLQVWEQVVEEICALMQRVEYALASEQLILRNVSDVYDETQLTRFEMVKLIQDLLRELQGDLHRETRPVDVEATEHRVATVTPLLAEAIDTHLPPASAGRLFPINAVTQDLPLLERITECLELCWHRIEQLRQRMEEEA